MAANGQCEEPVLLVMFCVSAVSLSKFYVDIRLQLCRISLLVEVD